MTLDEHLLTILAEECNEVAHRVSKALRFGLAEVQPGQDRNNSQRIADELADLFAAAEVLWHEVAILPQIDFRAVNQKKQTIREYVAYARQCGTISD